MEGNGHRYVIQYFYLKGFSPTNIKAELNSTLEFKRGRTSCQDEHRSGRPNEVTTSERVKKIHKSVPNDHRLKLRELAHIMGISKRAVHRILSENLDMRKLCARWVPCLLPLEQKQCCEDVSFECLAKLHNNKAEFLYRFITKGEYFTPSLHTRDKRTIKTID
ncbi:mariner transposase [Trichonephila clavipes]|nr:mariner transposase [Trichonephila clavipes]